VPHGEDFEEVIAQLRTNAEVTRDEAAQLDVSGYMSRAVEKLGGL